MDISNHTGFYPLVALQIVHIIIPSLTVGWVLGMSNTMRTRAVARMSPHSRGNTTDILCRTILRERERVMFSCFYTLALNVSLSYSVLYKPPVLDFMYCAMLYRIAENFRWCQFLRKNVQPLQKKFSWFLFSQMQDSLAMPHMRNGTKRRSEKASLCNNGLIFLCGGFWNYEGIKTAAAGEKLGRWIQHCWSRLWQLQSVSRICWYFV